jgi:hypothetical protein
LSLGEETPKEGTTTNRTFQSLAKLCLWGDWAILWNDGEELSR